MIDYIPGIMPLCVSVWMNGSRSRMTTISNESWNVLLQHTPRLFIAFHLLEVFHRRCLRTILGISWRDHFTDDELMRRAGMEDLSNIVRVRRLTLAGQLWLLSDRPANVGMQWVPDWHRSRRGRPRKTWRQTFQEDLQEMRVSWSGVSRVAFKSHRQGSKSKCVSS